MNGVGAAVMDPLTQEERELIACVMHHCDCAQPQSLEEAETWRHSCVASDLLNEATLARLSALRREAETREWGGET